MPSLQVTPQDIALVVAQGAFYVPKGIILPILGIIDKTKDLLEHEDIACAYCHKHRENPENSRNHLQRIVQAFLLRKQYWLTKKVEGLLIFSILFLTYLLPHSFINFLENFFQHYVNRWKGPLSSVRLFLSDYRSQVIWYGFVPLCLLTGCAWVFGIGILPEIYAFIAGSYWGGKIINHAANLLVRQKESAEWAFIKNPFMPSTRQDIKNLSLRLIMDICLLSVIQKFYQFVGYCFQAFFAWLLFYVAIKKASDESGTMLDNLGHEVKRENSLLPNYRPLKNALWLISYHSFKSAACEGAFKRYEDLHERRHLPLDPLAQSQINNEALQVAPLAQAVPKLRRSPRSPSPLRAR